MHGRSERRRRIGVLVPFTNTHLEPDCAAMVGGVASVHFTRIGDYPIDATPVLSEMRMMSAAEIDDAVALLAAVDPDVLLYGCASATLCLGPGGDVDFAARLTAASGARSITAAGAMVAALQSLGARRIGVATPYEPALTAAVSAFFAAAGFDVVGEANPSAELTSLEQGALSGSAMLDLVRAADQPAAEAVVLSCTDLGADGHVDALESEIGKPVVLSNQALLHAGLAALGAPTSTVPGALGRADRRETSRLENA